MPDWKLLNPLNWSRGQWSAFIIAFVAAVVIVWFGPKWLAQRNLPPSHQFNGSIQRVLGPTTLLIKGTHVPDANPDQADYANPQLVEVRLNAQTKLVKTLLYLPTQAETAKTGGVFFYPKDLRREEQVGSVADFKDRQGLGLTIKTKDSTYVGDKIITATEIDYIEPVYPK